MGERYAFLFVKENAKNEREMDSADSGSNTTPLGYRLESGQ